MSYKNLENFQSIFNRSDFNYISNHKKIKEIEEIILYCITNPNGKESSYVQLLEIFLKNLNSFYKSITGDNIPDMKKGYSIVFEELQRSIELFSEDELKRRSISRGYCKKFNKTCLYGLSKLLDGIRVAFDPDVVTSVNIEEAQYIRYILDDKEGLGKLFLFNKIGRHSFINKIDTLNMQELAVTVRLLIRPSGNQIRTINGWRDVGLGYTPVRLLCERRAFRKDKVYFLYRLNEHSAYKSQLETSPNKVAFLAA